jgi:hypothetical protein
MASTLASLCSRELGRKRFAHQGAAHGRVAVDGDGNADARAAQRNAALGFAGGHGAGQLVAIVGVVDAVGVVGAKVGHIMAQLAQPLDEIGLERQGGVIGSNGDAHGL